MESDTAAVRSYRISPIRRSMIWWILGPFLLMGLGIMIFGEEKSRGAGFIIILVTAPWLLFWKWYMGRIRLELSPEGVTHRQGKLVMHAPWTQVERVRLDWSREGIILREPLEGRAAERLAAIRGIWISGVPHYDEEQQQLMGQHRVIPIDPFAYLLRNGRLLAAFDEWAPELGKATRATIEERKLQKRLPKLPATPRQQMKLFWFIVPMGTLIGLGVWAGVAPDSQAARITEWTINVVYTGAMPLLAFVAAWSSRNSFRSGSKVLGIMFALLAVVLLLWSLVYVDRLVGLTRGEPPESSPTPTSNHPSAP